MFSCVFVIGGNVLYNLEQGTDQSEGPTFQHKRKDKGSITLNIDILKRSLWRTFLGVKTAKKSLNRGLSKWEGEFTSC